MIKDLNEKVLSTYLMNLPLTNSQLCCKTLTRFKLYREEEFVDNLS